MGKIAYDNAILTAAVVFLLAVASVYQYLMGVSGVPQLLGQVLGPLKAHPWLFLIGTAAMSCLFGMVLEGLPAAVVLIPVGVSNRRNDGIDPIHFNIVQTAAVGIGLFLPPMGVGLLMALRFANLSAGRHFRTYVPYMLALFAGCCSSRRHGEASTISVPRRASSACLKAAGFHVSGGRRRRRAGVPRRSRSDRRCTRAVASFDPAPPRNCASAARRGGLCRRVARALR